jgi:hypothetical protein
MSLRTASSTPLKSLCEAAISALPRESDVIRKGNEKVVMSGGSRHESQSGDCECTYGSGHVARDIATPKIVILWSSVYKSSFFSSLFSSPLGTGPLSRPIVQSDVRGPATELKTRRDQCPGGLGSRIPSILGRYDIRYSYRIRVTIITEH